jgi:hypothetical protein
VPGEESSRLFGQFERFMDGNGWFHGGPTRSSAEAYTTNRDSRKELFVWSIWFVSCFRFDERNDLDKRNKRDKPDQPDEPSKEG